MFLGCLKPPEGVAGVPVPVEELDRLAGVVQHMLSGQTLEQITNLSTSQNVYKDKTPSNKIIIHTKKSRNSH